MLSQVFVLVAVYTSGLGSHVHIETMTFQSAARCLRNLNANEPELKKQYDDVNIKCIPQDVIKDKK